MMALPVLEADCVAKRFGSRAVLTAASLRAISGQVTALLGRNGAGKSTLLRIACGVIAADTGIVRLRDVMQPKPTLAGLARQGVCFLPDRDLLQPMVPVRPQLQAMARLCLPDDVASDRVDMVAEALGITQRVMQKPRSLSGGERRRAEVALVLSGAPDVLLLDEPLRGIAPLDAEAIMGTIRGYAADGGAVVLTGHELPLLLPHVDRVTWCTAGTTREFATAGAALADHAFVRDFASGPPKRLS